MSKLLARLRVVATAAPTYLVAASTVVTIIADELGKVVTDDTAATITAWAARIVAWLGAAVLIIRRVSPVSDVGRGLLVDLDAYWELADRRGIPRKVARQALDDAALADFTELARLFGIRVDAATILARSTLDDTTARAELAYHVNTAAADLLGGPR